MFKKVIHLKMHAHTTLANFLFFALGLHLLIKSCWLFVAHFTKTLDNTAFSIFCIGK